MTAFVPRMTTSMLIGLALLLASCGTSPVASTSTPANTAAQVSATVSPTVPPSATHTASPAPATDTAEPPTATRRPATSTPSQTPAATETEAAATATQTVAPANTPAGTGDFTPTQASIWNSALMGGDNTSGTCTATANAPYGPMQLTPGDGTLALHNTVPEDYVLTRIAPNTYQYSGPAAVIEGTIKIDLRFTSATTLEMTRTFVSSAEPSCTHVHNYTGTFVR